MDTSEVRDRIAIQVPQLGVVESILVVEWHASNGEHVEAGDPIVSIDTDKALTELESPASGILVIAVPDGDTEVPVGTILGYIELE